jgi:hypothetical protein
MFKRKKTDLKPQIDKNELQDGKEKSSDDLPTNKAHIALINKLVSHLPNSKIHRAALALGGVIVISSLSFILYLNQEKTVKNTDTKKPNIEKKLEESNNIYRTTLDSSNFTQEELFDITYPFGKAKIENTKQYSRVLFEKVDSIIVDPTGQLLPTTSGTLTSLSNIPYGYANLNIELNALPRQSFFVRLVSEKNHEPFAVRHFYLKSDENRTVNFQNLSGGRYYLQILNLITQSAYVSTPFNLTANGLIEGSAVIKFIKIKDIDHIFQLPIEDEDSAILVEDIPIVLNADINREVLDFSKSAAIREAVEDD